MKRKYLHKLIDQIQSAHGIEFLEEIGRRAFREGVDTYLYKGVIKAPASSLHGDRPVVVKIVLSDDQNVLSYFEEEASLYTRFNHSNLIRIDFTKTKNFGRPFGIRRYIVMDFIDGENLSEIIAAHGANRRQITPQVAIHVVIEVLKALQFVHELKDNTGKSLHIIHGDISPRNILISKQGEVKLIDFGIAKSRIRISRKLENVIQGSLPYISPEQAESKPLDQRSDLYSLTLVLAELLFTVKINYHADSRVMIEYARNADYPLIDEMSSQLDPKIIEIIKKGLNKNPDERFQTADSMLECLEELVIAKSLYPKTNELKGTIEYSTNYFKNSTTQVNNDFRDDDKNDVQIDVQKHEIQKDKRVIGGYEKKWSHIFGVLVAIILVIAFLNYVGKKKNNQVEKGNDKEVVEIKDDKTQDQQGLDEIVSNTSGDDVTKTVLSTWVPVIEIKSEGANILVKQGDKKYEATSVLKPNDLGTFALDQDVEFKLSVTKNAFKPVHVSFVLNRAKPSYKNSFTLEKLRYASVEFGADVVGAFISVSDNFYKKEAPFSSKVSEGNHRVTVSWHDILNKKKMFVQNIQFLPTNSYQCVAYLRIKPSVKCRAKH